MWYPGAGCGGDSRAGGDCLMGCEELAASWTQGKLLPQCFPKGFSPVQPSASLYGIPRPWAMRRWRDAVDGAGSTDPKGSGERSPQCRDCGEGGAGSLPPHPCLLITLIYSGLVPAGYSHPCDTQHVLLPAAAGWIQPQGPASSRAGSCLLLRDIFGNEFCLPSSFLLAGPGVEGGVRLSFSQ